MYIIIYIYIRYELLIFKRNVICKACNNAHDIMTCPYMNVCQFCGNANNTSARCNDSDGMKKKVSCRHKCFRCCAFGHVTIDCTTMRIKVRFRFRQKMGKKSRRR